MSIQNPYGQNLANQPPTTKLQAAYFRGWRLVATTMLVAGLGLGFASIDERKDRPVSAASAISPVYAGEFVVELQRAVHPSEYEWLSRVLGARVTDRVRDNMVVVVDGRELALERLRENRWVKMVEPNFKYKALALPNDPELKQLWGLRNTGASDSSGQAGISGLDISAERAWDIETGSDRVVVAVIDTGIDFNHPDLKPQAWINAVEKNGKTGVDDDGNGYVDDIHGFNFANNKGDATDDNGHGTHCAGTIGAKGNDGRGLVGVAWNVKMMAVKFLDKNGSGSLANAIKSIDYARLNGAQIMSNSWGGGGRSELLFKAVQDASDAGILFVAAAGNDGLDNDVIPSYPANYEAPSVVSVAALDNRGQVAGFSNVGVKTVHVAAPGVNIVSTVPGGKYDSYSGTSMATPHVSGIAALMLSRDPNLKFSDIKSRLISSSRPLFLLKSKVMSGGIADAYYALTGLTPPADPNDPSKLPNSKPLNISTDHPYAAKAKLEQTIVVNGAKKVAIKFGKFETEAAYDTISFYDAKGTFVGSMSGKQPDGMTSPLIEGDRVTIRFVADETVQAYGFDIEAVLYE
jgi:thermitase